LLEEDSHWLAELNQTSTTEVDVVIKREFDANPDAQFPISSALIGALLDLPPDSVGKYSAVDQRVRRACIVLRTILTPNDEDSQT
jgi:hypothetical protein